MKFLILSITLLFSSLIFAGGGSVGTMRVLNQEELNSLLQNSKIRIIYGHNIDGNEINFSTGTVLNDQWEINNFTVPSALLSNSILKSKLQKSVEVKNWVDIN